MNTLLENESREIGEMSKSIQNVKIKRTYFKKKPMSNKPEKCPSGKAHQKHGSCGKENVGPEQSGRYRYLCEGTK